MAKALPVVGIVGALWAAFVIAVLADAALFSVVLVALAGSVACLGQRTVAGTVAGLLVLALGVLAALGLAGSITTERGDADFGIGEGGGLLFALAACLAVPVAATVIRWDEAQPAWLAWGGVGCAAVAIAIAASDPLALTDHGRVGTAVNAAFALLSMAPMVAILRSPGREEPAPLSSAETVVTAPSPPSRRP